ALAAVPLVKWNDIAVLNSARPCADVTVDATVAGSTGYVDIEEVVTDYLQKNGTPIAPLPNCQVVRTGVNQGYVLVQAREGVDFQVASAFGQSGSSVGGVSVAASDFYRGGGLRPIAICGLMSTLIYGDYPVVSLSALAAG